MASRNSPHIVDAETIRSVGDLEWIAKILASGFLHGKHESSRLGSGMEFQQYRPYIAGDDIRNVDWKMYAKTDKYYIKQTSIQTEHQTIAIIDNSLSMKYAENGMSKIFLAKILVAALTRVLANQGDRFTWQSNNQNLPLGGGLRHWQQCLSQLYDLKASENQPFIEPIKHTNTTFLWISDLYYSLSEIEAYYKKLKNPKSELIVFHLLGDAERTLDFSGNSTFVDLETQERIDVNAPSAKKAYQERLSQHITKVKNLSFDQGVFHHMISLNQPVAESLSKFFHHYQYIGAS